MAPEEGHAVGKPILPTGEEVHQKLCGVKHFPAGTPEEEIKNYQPPAETRELWAKANQLLMNTKEVSYFDIKMRELAEKEADIEARKMPRGMKRRALLKLNQLRQNLRNQQKFEKTLQELMPEKEK